MSEKFKIAIIIRAFNRGGVEVLIREMFENGAFNENLKNCDLIILDSKNIELVKDLYDVNYYIFNIFSASFLNFFREYSRLYKFIKRNKYTILHTHMPNAGILVRFLKILS